jgi:hypothetical protein
MKKLGTIIFIILVALYFMSKCDYGERYTRNTKTVEVKESEPQLLTEKERIEIEQRIFAVNNILKEFEDWEVDKLSSEVLYTLNQYNDSNILTYILTVVPQSSKGSSLKWTDMYYFRDIKDGDIVTSEEIVPMDKLASTISFYWEENKEWIDKVISGELPYEEHNDNYILSIDYYIYNNAKVGLHFKISNTKTQIAGTTTVEEGSITDKRQKLAKGIMEALNAPGHPEICTSVYFNNEGDLIIEATSYWSDLSENDRKDIIYLIEGILTERKNEINVEGYGQFFSPAGRGLESFYGN